MRLDERLKYCRICYKRRVDSTTGLLCSLTNAKPAFEPSCPSFDIDQNEASRLIALEKAVEQEEEEQASTDFFMSDRFAGIVGVPGGIALIVIGALSLIFAFPERGFMYYGPALVICGIIVIFKRRSN